MPPAHLGAALALAALPHRPPQAAEGYLGVPFLVARLWTGVWISIILGLCAVTDMCYLIKYITRFTDEIFAALISSIYEACKALLYPFKKDYDTCVEGQPCLDTLKDAIHDASTLMSLLLLRPGTATARSRLARGLTGA